MNLDAPISDNLRLQSYSSVLPDLTLIIPSLSLQPYSTPPNDHVQYIEHDPYTRSPKSWNKRSIDPFYETAPSSAMRVDQTGTRDYLA